MTETASLPRDNTCHDQSQADTCTGAGNTRLSLVNTLNTIFLLVNRLTEAPDSDWRVVNVSPDKRKWPDEGFEQLTEENEERELIVEIEKDTQKTEAVGLSV